MDNKVTVSITYCIICNFRGRAAWLAQELLAAHEGELKQVTLVPDEGGVFEVRINDELVFSRRRDDRFPEPREVKDALREALGLEPKPRHD
ncbi:MAG: Rdx family protein [Chloroflexi bacterium]|nr:Rdx family protein [Chloroflexota bacterium]